jgi:hypothetical protein
MLARTVLQDIDPVLAGGHDRPGSFVPETVKVEIRR